MTDVPERYQAEPRDHERKDRLYELYWGELLSARDIAAKLGVGKRQISEQLDEFGIPRRVVGYRQGNAVSPFVGFYRGTTDPVPTDEESRTRYEDRDESEFDGWEFTDWKGGAAADD